MSLKSAISLVVRAATVATLIVGTLGAGLTITTYTVAKANDLMFQQPVTPLRSEDSICV